MTFPIFIKDGIVAFSTSFIKPNLVQHEVDVENLYTPCGFLIPTDYNSFGIIDFLEDGFVNYYEKDSCNRMGVLIDHRGRIHEVYVDHLTNDATRRLVLTHRRVMVGKAGYVRTHAGEVEKAGMMALSLCATAQEAGELYTKLTTLNAPIYQSIKITDIMSRLNELAYVQPFPQLEG